MLSILLLPQWRRDAAASSEEEERVEEVKANLWKGQQEATINSCTNTKNKLSL